MGLTSSKRWPMTSRGGDSRFDYRPAGFLKENIMRVLAKDMRQQRSQGSLKAI
uniref:Cell division cycle 20B n=1 Tax=Nannospalax galili TaxID=1026970 RepID=A0A8C6WBF7_NANGA